MILRKSWALALAALVLAGSVRAGTGEDLADFESKVQYAYFTEDLQLLGSLVGGAAKPSSALDRYHLAHAQYRLALLTAGRDDKRSARAAEDCIKSLDRAKEQQADFVEAHVLQGACYFALARVQAYKSMLLGPLGTREIDKALALEPDNPRAVLLDGEDLRDRPTVLGGDRDRSFGRLQRAVRLFDTRKPSPPGGPSWGQAEAWVEVGHGYVERKDVANARNAFERALAVAPDYAAAQRALAALRQ
jgi:tetratricopeptide (TPR) repeat protein